MAVRGSRGAQQRAKTEAERARLYAARTAWNRKIVDRRRRDTIIAAVGGSLIVIGAIVSQSLHAQVTAPAPTPSPAVTQAPVAPSEPAEESPAPSPTPTEPSPTQTSGE